MTTSGTTERGINYFKYLFFISISNNHFQITLMELLTFGTISKFVARAEIVNEIS